MLTYRYAACTDKGKIRSTNEDNIYIDGRWKTGDEQGAYSESGMCPSGKLTAAVCDGMGGESHGEEASLIAVETIHEFGQMNWNQSSISSCIQTANARICEMAQKTGERAGTTLCLLIIDDDQAVAINVGDSRIYRYRDASLVQLSTDHSVIGSMVRQGKMTEAEARRHPLRHQLNQYLGIDPKEMGIIPAFYGPEKCRPGDRFLICSDGLTDMLTDQEIQTILMDEADTAKAARILKNGALDAGGRDNVSVILIDVMKEKKPQGLNRSGEPSSAVCKNTEIEGDAGITTKKATRKAVAFKVAAIALLLIAICCAALFAFLPKTYQVQVRNGSIGASGMNTASYKSGALVSIIADENDRRDFVCWEVETGDIVLQDKTSTETTFVMGREDVTIAATYKDKEWVTATSLGHVSGIDVAVKKFYQAMALEEG